MRFDTQRISAQLVKALQNARPHVEVTYDGGDLIRVSLESNETVHIYLIESPIPVYEIQGIVAANSGVGIYSLFILWSDLLPPQGARYLPDDWRSVLLALHGDQIYAFDAYFGDDLFIFPVYFEGAGSERTVRFGPAIDATRLAGVTISTASPLIAGVWRMANFDSGSQPDHEADTRPITTVLSVYYRRLGLAETEGRAAVKRAYYRLARKYHPDVNDDPAATIRMQQINEAYERILADLDQRGIRDDDR